MFHHYLYSSTMSAKGELGGSTITICCCQGGVIEAPPPPPSLTSYLKKDSDETYNILHGQLYDFQVTY